MKHDELFVGQPVWWIRDYAGVKHGLNNAAIVMKPPVRSKAFLTGLALRRPKSDEWYPMWASARNLAWRSIATETIPAFFVALATFAQMRVEVRYTLRILEDGKGVEDIPGFADVHAAIEAIDRRYGGAAVYQLPFFFAELADESEATS